MHGLINRSIEGFVRVCYGGARWREVAADIGLRENRFQSFRHYPDAMTVALIAAAAQRLGKPEGELLEDLGAWLARLEGVRRLLRFSGSDFADFVVALEELPDRGRMILPDLEVPRLAVEVRGPQQFTIRVLAGGAGWCAVIAGLLRAMSDDYGALALILDEGEAISVNVSDEAFGEGRDFDLTVRTVQAGGWA